MRTIKMVQFHDIEYQQGWEDTEEGDFNYVSDENDYTEFLVGEDEDGYEVYEEQECISIGDTIDTVKTGRHKTYIRSNNYSILEFDLET